MNKRSLQNFLLVFLCFLFSSIHSQWKYPSVKKIKNDVVINYSVSYDRILSEKEMQSSYFKKEIVVYFNKNKLVEKIISNKTDYQKFTLYDFENKKIYYATINGSKREATVHNFKLGDKHTPKFKQEKETILGIPSEICYYKVGNKTRKMLFTKELGLRFCKYYNLDGFLLQYSTKERFLGTYTVKASTINYGKLPDEYYSLDGFTIKTKKERDKEIADLIKLRSDNKITTVEKIGTKAPYIIARSIDGKKIRTKQLIDNKITVLNFWFTTCGPCKKEIPQLNKLKKTFEGKNVEFVAIALDQEYKIANFLKKNPFKYDIVEDGRWIANKLGVSLYPTNIIIDKKGKINYFKTGYMNDIFESMEYKINKLLKEKKSF